jgi:cellulose synthase/poly-beta-1,6-N-acetylglucosamine synthase-like glycosyltransferase
LVCFGLLLAALYAFLDLWLLKGLRDLKHNQIKKSEQSPTVNILISAKDEEICIHESLTHCLKQDYPKDKFKILIANDRSSDQTNEIIKGLQLEHPGRIELFNISECPKGLAPKKNALSILIAHSDAEWLVLTDADSKVPKNWVSSLLKEATPDTKMVLGSGFYSIDKSARLFDGLLALEFFSHTVVAAAAVGNKMPINSNGNSLAYRRETFNELGGFSGVSHISSGDDDLLLHKFKEKYPHGIRFSNEPGARVPTEAPQNLKELWNQRKRWASKTVHYPADVLTLLFFVFTYYWLISVLCIIGLVTQDLELLILGFTLFFIKSFGDLGVVVIAMRSMKVPRLFRFLIPAALIHIPLIFGAALFGILMSHNWKGKSAGSNS